MATSDATQPDRGDRRTFLTRVAYVTPAILTLPAVSAFAASGSGRDDEYKDHKEEKDHKEKDKDKKNK